MQNKRPFKVGVLAGAVCCGALAPVMVSGSEPALVGSAAIAVAAMAASALMTTSVGIPLARWLRARSRLSAAPLCAAGIASCALLLGSIIGWTNYWPQVNDPMVAVARALVAATRGGLFGAFFGLISSLAFCAGAGIPLRSSASDRGVG